MEGCLVREEFVARREVEAAVAIDVALASIEDATSKGKLKVKSVNEPHRSAEVK
jgi:hypothetical protein